MLVELSGNELALLLTARTLQLKLLAMLLWAIANLHHMKKKTLHWVTISFSSLLLPAQTPQTFKAFTVCVCFSSSPLIFGAYVCLMWNSWTPPLTTEHMYALNRRNICDGQMFFIFIFGCLPMRVPHMGRQGPNPKWVPATHTVVMMILWIFEPYDLGLIWSILPHQKCDLSKMLRVEIHIRKRVLERHLLFLRVTQSFFLSGAQHLWMPSVSAQHSPITCIIGEKNGWANIAKKPTETVDHFFFFFSVKAMNWKLQNYAVINQLTCKESSGHGAPRPALKHRSLVPRQRSYRLLGRLLWQLSRSLSVIVLTI